MEDITKDKTRLIGVGICDGKRADQLKIGDITYWNYGTTEEIVDIKPISSLTKEYIVKTVEGKLYKRKMRNNRLVITKGSKCYLK